MKKVYMFLAFFVALSLSLSAQNYFTSANAKPYHALVKAQVSLNTPQAKGPLAQNFEGTFPPLGWTLPTGDADWAQSADVNHTVSGLNSAIYDCYNIDVDLIGYLKTPELAVTAGDVTFSFWCNYYLIAGTYGDASNLYVDKSTDGGTTWTSGVIDYLATITFDTWTQFTIDLTANIGQNVTLRFRAISDYGSYNIAIDDVAGPAINLPAHDLAVTAIAPSVAVTASTVAPVVTISNYGASSENSYSVTLTDGTYNQTVPVSTAIASGATYNVTFPNWTPATAGNYTFTATVTLTGDIVATNNTLVKTIPVANTLTPALCFKSGFQPSKFYLEAPGAGLFNIGSTLTTWFARGAAFVPSGSTYKWFVMGSDYKLYSIDSTTGASTLVGSSGVSAGFLSGLTYDITTNTLYASLLSGTYPAFTFTLYTINQTTGVGTLVAASATTGTFFELACNSLGQLYVIEHRVSPATGRLFSVNKTTAALTLIGTDMGAEVSSNFQDIDFTQNDVLYLTASMGIDVALDGIYTINTTTGIATLVNAFPIAGTQVTGFAIPFAEPTTATDIITFNFNALSPAVGGIVNATAHTVALTVPYGTDVTALIPTITVSAGATIAPLTGVPQNFTAPFTYTVTASDAITTQPWVVTVTIAPVGVNDIDANEVSIYPNPANDVVNVKMNTTINQIDIINVNGQMILQSVINNTEVALNTSELSNGIYFLRIVTSNGVTMKKIQISK